LVAVWLIRTMSTLADAVMAEANSLATKEPNTRNQILEGCSLIIDQASDIAEKRSAYGDEAVRELFASCEASMRVQIQAAAEHKAQYAALNNLSALISENSSPQAVQDAFAKAVTEQQTGSDEENFAQAKLKELRDIIDKSERSATGAGPSDRNDDADMDDEEGFTMTQSTSSHKCPLLQVQMEATGDLRPVRCECNHVFSYKGLTEYLKQKKGTAACPISGCSKMLNNKQLREAKDIAKEIKKASRDAD